MKSTDQIFHLSTFSDSNSFMTVGPDDLLHMGGGPHQQQKMATYTSYVFQLDIHICMLSYLV